MNQQLRLLEGGARKPWNLDARTRRAGRNGVAAARAALQAARPPEPVDPLRRAG